MAPLLFLGWFIATANGQDQGQRDTEVAGSSMHVRHVLGFGGIRHNASGDLSIHDDRVRFERDESPAAEVTIASIRNISLGTEDKQVGGVPMMLGKAAVPFGGGRVVSLFSHKKYDSLTIEYLDSSGGFHGAIFQLPRGQGLIFKNRLIAHDAHIVTLPDPIPVESASQASLKADQHGALKSTESILAPQLLTRASRTQFTRASWRSCPSQSSSSMYSAAAIETPMTFLKCLS